jgi:hypothetical protein
MLLWRGSRDGFGGDEFHRRCDGHANTLTLIQDINGNVFGGFTPVEWESTTSTKADDSLRSFLFTLSNPYCVRPHRFALREEMKEFAVRCQSERSLGCGPAFGYDWHGCCDISVSANAEGNFCCTEFAIDWRESPYADPTLYANGALCRYLFTGTESVVMKEIEVFEITDSMRLKSCFARRMTLLSEGSSRNQRVG